MHLFLIRHGQSFNNALEDPSQRVADPELTEKGFKQARIVASYIADGLHLQLNERKEGAGLDKLFCSPMIRTLETVKPISCALQLTPRVWVDVHEVGGIYLEKDGGSAIGFPGYGKDEIESRFAGYECDEVEGTGWWKDGKETPEKAWDRAVRVAQFLIEQSSQLNRVGVVSHGGFMSELIKALGVNPENQRHPTMRYRHENTSITRIDFNDDGAVEVAYLNRITHLPEELLTV